MNSISKILFFSLLIFTQCVSTSERCETYECRRQNIEIYIENQQPIVEEATSLVVYRKEYYLPKMRVLLGDFDENFDLSDEVDEVSSFETEDSVASVTLIFETAGEKIIRGIVEEYEFVSQDSIESYRYPFELTVNAIEHPDSLKISI